MAQAVRTKLIVLAAAAFAAAACDGDAPGQPPEVPRAVATADWPAGKVIDAVLDECHGGLYRDAGHREGMDHVACNVTLHGAAAATDGEVVQVFAVLPQRLRVQRPDGRMFVLLGDDARIYGNPGAPVAAADATWLRQLRAVVDAAAFGALYRCKQPTRSAPDTFALPQPDGSHCALTLRHGTLLPAAIESTGRVEIVDYLRPGPRTTWIASRLRLAGFGECELSFTGYGMSWDAEFFDPNGLDSAPSARTRTMTLGGNPDQRPSQPEIGRNNNKAACQVVFADPGDWPARTAAFRRHHEELVRQGQQLAGFAAFFQRDGTDWMAIGFRRRDDGPAFTAPADWHIEELPVAEVLQVYPTAGSFAAKVASGTKLLQAALAARGLQATGPIVAQPYLHFENGEPPAEKLAEPVVRVSVPVR